MAVAEKPAPVRAEAKYVRTAPRKAQLVAEQIRGRPVPEARAILAFMTRDAARDVEKVWRRPLRTPRRTTGSSARSSTSRSRPWAPAQRSSAGARAREGESHASKSARATSPSLSPSRRAR
jgi:ribosomal protein L22